MQMTPSDIERNARLREIEIVLFTMFLILDICLPAAKAAAMALAFIGLPEHKGLAAVAFVGLPIAVLTLVQASDARREQFFRSMEAKLESCGFDSWGLPTLFVATFYTLVMPQLISHDIESIKAMIEGGLAVFFGGYALWSIRRRRP